MTLQSHCAGRDEAPDLFVKTEDPVFIFNQGRCFEQNGHFEEAINRFLEYLRKAKKASGQDRADTERHIADCRPC